MSSSSSCIRRVTSEEVHAAWLIEVQGFPSDEAASEETCEFRQRVAPELFWGYFQESRLIGYICATKTCKNELTHDSFVNHEPDGKVICVHSLCVHPEFRRKGIATLLMEHFLEFVEEKLNDVSKVCLLCHDVLIPFYKRLRFQCLGPSAVTHGPTPWYDMEYCCSHVQER